MSNKPSSIIINSAKIDRIDHENVGLEVSANVLDSENNAIPDTEVALIINRLNIDTIISDSDGFIDIKKTLELQEGENISVQLKEIISGVKSSVRMISDVPSKQTNKEVRDNSYSFTKLQQKYHRDNLMTPDYVMELLELNPDNFLINENIKKYLDFSGIMRSWKIGCDRYRGQPKPSHICGDGEFIGLINFNKVFNNLINQRGHKFFHMLRGLPQLYRIEGIINDSITDKQKIVELISLIDSFLEVYEGRSLFQNFTEMAYCPSTFKNCIEFLSKYGEVKIVLDYELPYRDDIRIGCPIISIKINMNELNINHNIKIGNRIILLFPRNIIEKSISEIKDWSKSFDNKEVEERIAKEINYLKTMYDQQNPKG